MKKYIAAATLVLMFSAAALAQQAPGNGRDPGKRFAPENFQDTKARVLQMIEERRARLDQEKACIEKAENMEEMKKCRPEPRMGRGGMGGPGGPQEERPLRGEQK